jgi:hypothetical protein
MVCQLAVTSGFAPGGSNLGTETVTVPYSGGAVQLTAYACGDPTCATGTLNNPYGPPAPPTLVTINNGGSVYTPNSTSYPNSTYYPNAPYFTTTSTTPPNYNTSPDYNPAWNTTPNPCFHVAGSEDPCRHPDSNQRHHHGDSDGDGN